MLTSGPRPGDERRALALGVSSYLIKPVKQSDLLDRMLEALEAAARPARWRARSSDRRAGGSAVLVAEDNPVNQKVAAGLLERAGHRAVVVENGRQALAPSRARAFDLVLMDVQMPELDGLETTAAIRERERKARRRRVPIVAVTAHAMKGDAERCLAAGMDAYLAKPLQPASSSATIARLAPGAALDEARLLERVGGDRRALAEVARIFLADAPRRVARDPARRRRSRRARAARRGPRAQGRRLELRRAAASRRPRSSCSRSARRARCGRPPPRSSGSSRTSPRCGESLRRLLGPSPPREGAAPEGRAAKAGRSRTARLAALSAPRQSRYFTNTTSFCFSL